MIAPSASAITRSVLESKAMSASRRLVISAATRTPSSFFWKSAITAAIFFCALVANGLRSTVAFSASAFCRCGIAARAAAPKQPERGLRFDREFDIGQPQRLLRLIEHRLAPDMHIGFAAEAEEALLLLGVHQQRNQQPVAGSRDAGALHGDIDRARAVLGKGLSGELRLDDLVDLGERHVDRHADATRPGSAARW